MPVFWMHKADVYPELFVPKFLLIFFATEEKDTTTRPRQSAIKKLDARTTSPYTCGRQVFKQVAQLVLHEDFFMVAFVVPVLIRL